MLFVIYRMRIRKQKSNHETPFRRQIWHKQWLVMLSTYMNALRAKSSETAPPRTYACCWGTKADAPAKRVERITETFMVAVVVGGVFLSENKMILLAEAMVVASSSLSEELDRTWLRWVKFALDTSPSEIATKWDRRSTTALPFLLYLWETFRGIVTIKRRYSMQTTLLLYCYVYSYEPRRQNIHQLTQFINSTVWREFRFASVTYFCTACKLRPRPPPSPAQ